jgi:hypothetical protein
MHLIKSPLFSFEEFVQSECHPPRNRPPKIDRDESTPFPADLTPIPQALWVLGEKGRVFLGDFFKAKNGLKLDL